MLKAKTRVFTFSIAEEPLYPHIRLTREAFPRALSTRIVSDDDAEYFGPFLNRTAARILIDFLNQTFRLRTCLIDVDGSFPVPCTQYYDKRCVAPCVENLCDKARYLEIVGFARLFLQNDRDRFEIDLRSAVETAAGELDFEYAAFLRDMMGRVGAFWKDKRRRVWIDDAVDTLTLDIRGDEINIYLVTTRSRWTLGSRVFVFEAMPEARPEQALADVIAQFYKVDIPREIRVSHEFLGRRDLAIELSIRFDRPLNITVTGSAFSATSARALNRTKLADDVDRMKPSKHRLDVSRRLQRIFGLATPPRRIEAVDAAHISGTSIVAAISVWNDGRFMNAENYSESSLSDSELGAITEFIAARFRSGNGLPDLLVVDGGSAHVKAAAEGIHRSGSGAETAVIGAVKPRGRHSDLSHFILKDGTRVEYNADKAPMQILKILRDEAHDLSNSAHRQTRDMSYYYELAGILPSIGERDRQRLLSEFGSLKRILQTEESSIQPLLGRSKAALVKRDLDLYGRGLSLPVAPLVVPIRYDDPDGEAGDLRPIKAY